MRIGLAYDLKSAVPVAQDGPEDALAEYDCSETIGYITRAIELAGHSVVGLGGGPDFLRSVLRERIDFVFNFSEGRGDYRSREAQVPGVLEMLDIPYSGSDPACLAICLDKPLTKQLVSLAGVVTPEWLVISTLDELRDTLWTRVRFPVIVKPAWEGSSKGIRLKSLADDPGGAWEIAEEILRLYHQPAMVEEFIRGDEVTVGMVGNSPPRAIGMMRILPRRPEPRFVYSIEVKRDWQNLVDYECPACLETGTLDRLAESSLTVFSALGCRDFARLDFRINQDGIPYFLEINPLPGLGDYSDLVIMAGKMGISHESLIQAVLYAALQRNALCVPKSP